MSNVVLKSYLFVVDSTTMSLDSAINIVDKIDEVVNWEKVLPDAAVLVSKLDIISLQDILHSNLGTQRYLLTALEKGKKTGWLARDSWIFINNPTSVHED